MTGALDCRLLALREAFKAGLAGERAAIVSLSSEPGQRDGLLACVHRLAGVAGMFGAWRIGAAAERVEEALRGRHDGPLDRQLAELLIEIDCELGRP